MLGKQSEDQLPRSICGRGRTELEAQAGPGGGKPETLSPADPGPLSTKEAQHDSGLNVWETSRGVAPGRSTPGGREPLTKKVTQYRLERAESKRATARGDETNPGYALFLQERLPAYPGFVEIEFSQFKIQTLG